MAMTASTSWSSDLGPRSHGGRPSSSPITTVGASQRSAVGSAGDEAGCGHSGGRGAAERNDFGGRRVGFVFEVVGEHVAAHHNPDVGAVAAVECDGVRATPTSPLAVPRRSTVLRRGVDSPLDPLAHCRRYGSPRAGLSVLMRTANASHAHVAVVWFGAMPGARFRTSVTAGRLS